jgi:hypothetical protein
VRLVREGVALGRRQGPDAVLSLPRNGSASDHGSAPAADAIAAAGSEIR